MIKVHINKQKLNCSSKYKTTVDEAKWLIKIMLSSNNPKWIHEILSDIEVWMMDNRSGRYDTYVWPEEAYELYKNDLDTFLAQYTDKELIRSVQNLITYRTDLQRELLFKNPKAYLHYILDDWPEVDDIPKQKRKTVLEDFCKEVREAFNISQEKALQFITESDRAWFEYVEKAKTNNSGGKINQKIAKQFKELLTTPDSMESIEANRSYKNVALLYLADGLEKTEKEMQDIFKSYNGNINAFLKSFTTEQLLNAYESFLQYSSYESIARNYSLKTVLDFENIIHTYGTKLRARKQIASLLGITEQDAKALLSEMFDD